MSKPIVTHIPKTSQEIFDCLCPECGSFTRIDWLHVGGRGKQPHLVCPNHRSGCQTYIVYRLDPDLYNDYLDWLVKMDKAKVAYVANLEAERTLPLRFSTLEQIIKQACPTCDGGYEVTTTTDGLHYVRCVNPYCCRHCILYPITPKLANAYQKFVRGEKTDYGAMEEANQ